MTEEASWSLAEGDELAPGLWAVRLLGGGHRYEAYLAWHDDLHALVAVKILRPDLVADAGALEGLAGEARALARLAHPGIVRAFDAVLDGERPHLVLEFLDGPRLSTLLRRYGVAVEQLLSLALELCSALHYLSTRRYVHLDVKPRNIIMAGPPRLVDLSVAKAFDELASISGPIGTDAYMAPEQCDPALFGEIESRTDVWGMGATLYEALAKSPPFPAGARGAGARPRDRFPQLVDEPRPLPDDVPRELSELVLSCLEKRPPDRPSAAELALALEPLVAGLPRPRIGLFRPGGRARRGDFQIG